MRFVTETTALETVDDTGDGGDGSDQPVAVAVDDAVTSDQFPLSDPTTTVSSKSIRKDDDDGGLIVLKLRDMDVLTREGRTMDFVLRANTTLSEFMSMVTARTGLTEETVSVVYQTNTGDSFDLSHFPGNSEFSALGISPSREKTYSLCLMKKRRARGQAAAVVVEPENDETVNVTRARVIDPEDNDDEDDEILHREFVGLKNQQQTCYLNSLLQSLFFCPEFRNFIYNQIVPYDPEKKSVILALQKIFLQLQFSVRTAIETDELTRTFGWKEDHNFVQHDIEELYRALLDHLGAELKRNGEPAHADGLFGGLMNDYVKCLQCHQKNSKVELSLGISLPVRAFGEKLAEPTLEEALRNFVQVEVLTHPNQYRCEKCSTLVDAEKGTVFQKLPYFLSFQLRRWEFDLTVLARRKINDRISFPFVLNMDPFMASNDNGGDGDDDKVPAIDPTVIGAQLRSSVGPRRLSHSRPQAKIRNKDLERRQRPGTDHLNGGHVYELLAVWVHEGGSSHRGHYYSYVYDLEKCSWYLCNDSYVRKSSETEITKSFGGHSDYSYDSEKGEAYMLIYRRREAQINTLPMTRDDLPTHIQELWTSMEVTDRSTHEKEVYEKRIRRVRLCRRKPDSWEVDTVEAAFDKVTSLKATALEAYKIFHPDTDADNDPESVRLVRFNTQTLVAEESWDSQEDEAFGSVVRRHADSDLDTVLLEVKSSQQTSFEPYAVTDGILLVNLVDWASGVILSRSEIRVPNIGEGLTLDDVLAKIATKFNLPKINLTLTLRMARDIGSVHVTDVQTILTHFHTTGATSSRVVELMAQNVDHDLENFVQWSSLYYGCYSFEVECQLVPNPGQNRPRYRSETEPQFEFDPLDGPGVNGCDDRPPRTVTSDRKISPGQYFYVQNQEPISPGWEKLRVRVSPSMTLTEFSYRLSLHLNQDDSEFILYGVTKGQVELEYTHGQRNTTLKELEGGDFIGMRTRIGRKLRADEVRAGLYLLDFPRYKKAPALLCEVVLHAGMGGSEVKEVCIRAAETRWATEEQGKVPCFRIRKKKGSYPARVVRDTTKFRDIFLSPGIGELYVQPIPVEDSVTDKDFFIVIRHWEPSRLELGEPFEIKITHDYSERVELLIRDEVATATTIETDHLEYTVPELDIEYPYDLNPLVLQEKVTWKKFGVGRIPNVHTDQCGLIVRDCTEVGRDLSKAERKEYSKEIGQYIMSPSPLVRFETGLCINLARTPPH